MNGTKILAHGEESLPRSKTKTKKVDNLPIDSQNEFLRRPTKPLYSGPLNFQYFIPIYMTTIVWRY